MECQSCGGKLKGIGKNTYQCNHCGSRYYVSLSFWKRLTLNIPVSKILLAVVAIVMAAAVVGILVYHIYTVVLVKNASRFSGVFRDFLLSAYDVEVAELQKEDLDRIKYLRIEWEDGYLFTYSFEDPYAYTDKTEFQDTLRSRLIENKYGISGFIPEDVLYFEGVTKLELLTRAWGDYELPKENGIRSISCVDGLSENRKPKLFQQANPQTLEEVMMYAGEEENLADLSFLQDIAGVKRLYLQRAVLTDAHFLRDFTRLEEVYLEYPVIENGQVYDIVEGILQCPNLKKLTIEGKAGWYIEEDDWETLEEKYGERVLLERS